MIDLLYYGAAFVVALGLLIVVHEYGHYRVARALGVKVLRFSIGFGRPLWSRRFGRDQTELVVGWVPLGGYVKMLDEHEGEVAPEDLRRAFNRQPVGKRVAIVLAGPLANFVFAIFAYWAVFMGGVEGIRPVVGQVMPGSIAERAGFQAGEEIVRLDGRAMQSWGQHRLHYFRRALEQRPIQVDVRTRAGELVTRTLDLSDFPAAEMRADLLERGIGLIGYLPEPLPVIGALETGPAAAAGLRVGDRIVEINGRRIESWMQLAKTVREHPGKTLAVTVVRDGERLGFELTPQAEVHEGQTVGRIRVRPQFAEIPADMRVALDYGPLMALGESVENTWTMSWLTLKMLQKMLVLEVSTSNISGPITIAEHAGKSAKIGFIPFVSFLAVISISLGVLNLLPIPVLDGGHLLYYAIEALRGKPLPERVLAWGQQIGIALLAGLMFLAFYNDLIRLFQ